MSLPDIEKGAGRGAKSQKLSRDVPMPQRQVRQKSIEGKRSMFIVLREKVGKSQSAGCHFLKSGQSRPSDPKRDVDDIPDYEESRLTWRRGNSSSCPPPDV